jgi:hypothetical protein
VSVSLILEVTPRLGCLLRTPLLSTGQANEGAWRVDAKKRGWQGYMVGRASAVAGLLIAIVVAKERRAT